MSAGGVERAPAPRGAACWMCGLPAVCEEKLPGRRSKVRALCQTHADAVFGNPDPTRRRLNTNPRPSQPEPPSQEPGGASG